MLEPVELYGVPYDTLGPRIIAAIGNRVPVVVTFHDGTVVVVAATVVGGTARAFIEPKVDDKVRVRQLQWLGTAYPDGGRLARYAAGVQPEEHIVAGGQKVPVRNGYVVVAVSAGKAYGYPALLVVGTVRGRRKPDKAEPCHARTPCNVDAGIIGSRLGCGRYGRSCRKVPRTVEKVGRAVDLGAEMVCTVQRAVAKTATADKYTAVGHQDRHTVVGPCLLHRRHGLPSTRSPSGGRRVKLGDVTGAHVGEHGPPVEATGHEYLSVGQYGTVVHGTAIGQVAGVDDRGCLPVRYVYVYYERIVLCRSGAQRALPIRFGTADLQYLADIEHDSGPLHRIGVVAP